MAEITAGMVRELREKTDAPMMECKKALTEANGDAVRAEEILRIKLGNKANKAASRVAAEGVVAIHIAADGKLGAMVEVNCETDFVAKNGDFLAFAGALAELVATRNPADVTALSALSLKDASVEETRKALVGKIGENMTVRRFTRMAAKGRLASYVHGGAKIGVLVDVAGGDEALAKDLAMHIAASKPVALAKEEVPAALVQKERDIAAAKAAESGKPANIVEKMVEGSVQKFLREVTLLGQPFVKDDKQTVEQLLKSRNATVAGFALFVVGEGIEKKKDDFAAEVMAQVGQMKH
ncbi:MAG: translation elongation factor Ts [Burkholderiales bacterium]|nr:translation elongation factor Ts [Burkholderiales bacterium]